jgi:hypothetical protein
MTDETRPTDLEAEDGEVLPNRELMSIVSTDPSDSLVPPDGFGIPVADPPDETRPVEPAA